MMDIATTFSGISRMVTAITQAPGNIVDFFTDPIWLVILICGLIVIACGQLRKFFPDQSPIWGAVAVGAILYAIATYFARRTYTQRAQKRIDAVEEELRQEREKPRDGQGGGGIFGGWGR